MTEAEWLACANSPAMLIFLRWELTPEENQRKAAGLNSSSGLLSAAQHTERLPLGFGPLQQRFSRAGASCLSTH